MDCHQNIQSRTDLRQSDWNTLCREWLHELEREQLENIGSTERAESFVYGRVMSKQLILRHWAELQSTKQPIANELFISSKDGMGRSVRPSVNWNGRRLPIAVSISHSESSVMAVVGDARTIQVGSDITSLDVNQVSSLRLWLTDAENKHWNQDDREALLSVWALKEAIYKASNNGDRFRPRRIEVLRSDDEYYCRIGSERKHDLRLTVSRRNCEVIAIAVKQIIKG